MNPWLAAIVEGVDWVFDRWRHEGEPESVQFDADHGVDTAGWTLDYEPVGPSVCEAVLDALPDRALRASFYDLGCGKGRVLLLASKRPFRRVVGVEMVAGLVRTCRANLAGWQGAHPDCGPLEVLHADGIGLTLPADDLVVFLYNPFGEEGIAAVLHGLADRRAPGSTCWVAYVNPLEGHLLTDPPWSLVASGGDGSERWTLHALSSTARSP